MIWFFLSFLFFYVIPQPSKIFADLPQPNKQHDVFQSTQGIELLRALTLCYHFLCAAYFVINLFFLLLLNNHFFEIRSMTHIQEEVIITNWTKFEKNKMPFALNDHCFSFCLRVIYIYL